MVVPVPVRGGSAAPSGSNMRDLWSITTSVSILFEVLPRNRRRLAHVSVVRLVPTCLPLEFPL